jgi:hypothetical protein
MPAMLMEHDVDPAKVLWDNLAGVLDDIDVFNNQVLLAIYDRPERTKSGIMLPKKYLSEEQWQGKACLLVKFGTAAFEDPEERWFVGTTFHVGDWVVIRPSDGFPITVLGPKGQAVLCRMVNDTAIRARVKRPDMVW